MSYTSRQFQITDNSTVANFIAWGSMISAAIASMGWAQQTDTGQIVWTATVLTLTQATRISGNTKYNYSSFTGPTPRVGMSVIITGFANAGNNVTATITAITPGSSGDFTVVNGTGVNETHAGSATTTAVSSQGGGYEIWAPADPLQTGSTAFYLKISYGINSSQTSITVQLGTSTNGAGTLGGVTTTANNTTNAITSNATNKFPCYFSGDTNRLGTVLFWGAPGGPNWIVIERTKNVDGTDSSDGVCIWAANAQGGVHQVIVFAASAVTANHSGPYVVVSEFAEPTTVFNGTVPLKTCLTQWGVVGNHQTAIAAIPGADIPEGSTFTVLLYGQTRTYVALSTSVFGFWGGQSSNINMRWCLRYD